MERQRGCLLHNLGKAHGLVYTRDGYCQILDNRRDCSTLFGTLGMELRPYPKGREFVEPLLIISWREDVESISIAYKLSKPLTLVASLLNFWPKASDRLCAGSVD